MLWICRTLNLSLNWVLCPALNRQHGVTESQLSPMSSFTCLRASSNVSRGLRYLAIYWNEIQYSYIVWIDTEGTLFRNHLLPSIQRVYFYNNSFRKSISYKLFFFFFLVLFSVQVKNSIQCRAVFFFFSSSLQDWSFSSTDTLQMQIHFYESKSYFQYHLNLLKAN